MVLENIFFEDIFVFFLKTTGCAETRELSQNVIIEIRKLPFALESSNTASRC